MAKLGLGIDMTLVALYVSLLNMCLGFFLLAAMEAWQLSIDEKMFAQMSGNWCNLDPKPLPPTAM